MAFLTKVDLKIECRKLNPYSMNYLICHYGNVKLPLIYDACGSIGVLRLSGENGSSMVD